MKYLWLTLLLAPLKLRSEFGLAVLSARLVLLVELWQQQRFPPVRSGLEAEIEPVGDNGWLTVSAAKR